MSFKNVLLGIFLLSCSFMAIPAQDDTNYLVYAYDTAMNIQYRVTTGMDAETLRLTEEVDALSQAIIDRVLKKADEITTEAQGNNLQGCVLQVSTSALSLINAVQDQMDHVHNQSHAFHTAVYQEIGVENILLVDFETYFYEFMNRLYENYYSLNDQIYGISNSILRLVNSREDIISMLENCMG